MASLPFLAQEFERGNAQGGSDVLEGHECDVAFATFDRTHVGPMDPAPSGELLLRQAELLSKAAQVAGENSVEVSVTCHGSMLASR
jgi:hypothetical protein